MIEDSTRRPMIFFTNFGRKIHQKNWRISSSLNFGDHLGMFPALSHSDHQEDPNISGDPNLNIHFQLGQRGFGIPNQHFWTNLYHKFQTKTTYPPWN